MHPPEPDQLGVERGGLRQMDGDIGLVPQHVGRAHRAVQVDDDIGKRFLEFDQARGHPEGAEALGHRDPDLAGQRVGDRAAGAHQVKGRGLHALDRRDHHGAFVGQMGAMDVAGKQGGAGLPLEIVDPPADCVDG